MRTSTTLTSIAVAIAVLFAVLPLAASTAPHDYTFDNEFFAGDSAATVSLDPGILEDGTEAVIFNWRHMLASGEVLETTESIKTPFAPTVATDVGNGIIAVAGIAKTSGNTVLQLWEMNAPEAIDLGPAYRVLNPKGVRRLFVVEDQGVDKIGRPIWISKFRSGTTYHVQYDTGELWEYSLTAQSPQLVGSHAPQSSLPAVPFSRTQIPLYSLRHVDHGCYIMLFADDGGLTPDVLLRDANEDGAFDSWTILTEALRISMGLDDPTKLVP